MEMLHDPDVRPFGDSLGLIQTTDPLLGTSVAKALYQRPLVMLFESALFLVQINEAEMHPREADGSEQDFDHFFLGDKNGVIGGGVDVLIHFHFLHFL